MNGGIDLRTCVVCKQSKEESEYYRYSSKNQHSLMLRCKECHKERQQLFRRVNKDHYNKQGTDRRTEQKLRAINLLGGKCYDCGISYPPCVYDFHHTNPLEKDGFVGSFLHRSWDKVIDEINKCVLLCSNCHRLRHMGKPTQDKSIK